MQLSAQSNPMAIQIRNKLLYAKLIKWTDRQKHLFVLCTLQNCITHVFIMYFIIIEVIEVEWMVVRNSFMQNLLDGSG